MQGLELPFQDFCLENEFLVELANPLASLSSSIYSVVVLHVEELDTAWRASGVICFSSLGIRY